MTSCVELEISLLLLSHYNSVPPPSGCKYNEEQAQVSIHWTHYYFLAYFNKVKSLFWLLHTAFTLYFKLFLLQRHFVMKTRHKKGGL